MNEEPVEPIEEQDTLESYDELYDKGFDEGSTEVENEEDPSEEEESEQPEDDDLSTEELTGEIPAEVEPEENEKEEDSDKYAITHKGQEMNMSIDELRAMAQKGFDYTSKTQNLSKQRDIVEVAVENGLTKEDLVILADIKSGNKEAMALLANKAEIDPYDIDGSGEYKPEVTDRNYELEDIVSDIKSDIQNNTTIDEWITQLPESAIGVFSQNPSVLKGLHVDAQKGLAQEIMPEVMKQMALNPNANFVSMYQTVGKNIMDKKESKPTPSRQNKLKASISKNASTSRQLDDQKDIWEDDALYAKMQKMREQ